MHIDRIKPVQKNFLIFALRGLNWDTSLILPSYYSRLLLNNLPSLANRRTMLGITIIKHLIHGDVERVPSYWVACILMCQMDSVETIFL